MHVRLLSLFGWCVSSFCSSSSFGATEGVALELDDAASFNPPHKGGKLSDEDATYVYPPTVSARRRMIWYPGSASDTDSNNFWDLVYPELCDVGATKALSKECQDPGNESCDIKASIPGLGSKKIALVMRGDSVRLY